MCDLAHVAGWDPYSLHGLLYNMFPGLDIYYQVQFIRADHAQPLTTADEELNDLSVVDDLQ